MKKRLIYILLFLVLLQFNTSFAFGAGTSISQPQNQGSTILKGNIQRIDFVNNKITIVGFNDKKSTVNITSSTSIEIEGKEAQLKDLYYGQEVQIYLNGKRATKIIGFTEEDPDRDGYISPETRFRTGDVLFISKDSIEIKGKMGREKYRINEGRTRVTKNGEIAKLFQVKPGDKVMLTFDDIYSAEVSNIKVEDDERHIEGILKGKIEQVDEKGKSILIKEPYIYKEGKWVPYGESKVKMKIEDDNIYDGGQKISLGKLREKKNKEVYAASENRYGVLKASKILIKSGFSVGYKDVVSDIEYGRGRMVVDKNPLYFHPGTIVVKDNRLVDYLNIDLGQDVFVYADMNEGKKVVDLVSIEGTGILDDRIDGTKILVYKGKIEDIYDYEIKIGKISYRLDQMVLDNNRFVEIEEPQRVILTDDTYIYDSQLRKSIPANMFMNSRYISINDIKDSTLRNRLKNNYYKNKIAYFVVRESVYGKEVLSINLVPQLQEYKQTVKTDYGTIGEIGKVDADRGTLRLIKVKNFNTLNKRWENSADETIDLSKSVILVNDVPLPIDEIYKLKGKSRVYLVKNRTTSEDTSYVLLVER